VKGKIKAAIDKPLSLKRFNYGYNLSKSFLITKKFDINYLNFQPKLDPCKL
jgi:hypothetical protein